MSQRGWRGALAELVPLLLVAGMTFAGFAALAVNGTDVIRITPLDLRAPVVFIGVLVGVWLSMRLGRYRGDLLLLPLVAALCGLGLVTLARLTPDLQARRGLEVALADRQLVYVVIALLVVWGVGLFFPDPERVAHYRYLILLGGLALLFLTAVAGTEIYGARLWIVIGPVVFQPAELVKIGLVFFLASYLAERGEVVAAPWRLGPLALPPLPYLIPMGAMLGIALVMLVALNDLGTALLFFSIFLAMLYAATGRSSYVLGGLILFAAASLLAYHLFGRVQVRVANWLDPWQDPLMSGYQPIQSDYALSSGGVIGTGLGRGSPWLIPVVENDFILSAIGEESGLVGALSVVAINLLVAGRGIMVAARCRSTVNRLLVVGLTASIAFQAVIIMAGVLRLLPLTGITLPFVAYGGSSLVTNALAIGLILRISSLDHGREALA